MAGITSIVIITCLYMLVTLAIVRIFLCIIILGVSANWSYQYAVSDYATLTDDVGQDNSALQLAGMVRHPVQ